MSTALHEHGARSADWQEPVAGSLPLGEMNVTRSRPDEDELERPFSPPCAEAFSVVVPLCDTGRQRVWQDGALIFEGARAPGALAIADLRSRWQLQHLSPFDDVRFHVPFESLQAFAADIGRPDYIALSPTQSSADPVMLGLAKALLPALARPEDAHPLFLTHMRRAILAHLVQRYGGLKLTSRATGTLAAWQERKVIDHIVRHLDAPVSIAELAHMCGLSRSYFIKAFGRSFGRTPHRWLTDLRVRKARDLLRGSMSIAEVAYACGFADQSHFTRVFSDAVGVSPARFRQPPGVRQLRNGASHVIERSDVA